jgi:hypothetical protein
MRWIFAIQFVVPLMLIVWLALAPAHSGLGFMIQVIGSVAATSVRA